MEQTFPWIFDTESPKPNTELLQEAAPNFRQYEVMQVVNYVFLCISLCIFGITTNIINIVVFVKQGFNYTMNISLLGLSVSDLSYLIFDLFFSICMVPFLRNADVPFDSDELQYLAFATPSVCCSRISGWITAFITVERCLGIAVPLKVKQIITSRRTAIVIVSIYFGNILAVLPEYFNFKLDLVLHPDRNRTILRLVKSYSDGGKNVATYLLLTLAAYLSFTAVVVFTIILVVKLNQKSTWRKRASITDSAMLKSSRERRTAKMVILLASIMIVCYTPGTIVLIAMILRPEFNILSPEREIFLAAWSFPFVFQNINASVNIFLYFRMSTKYRQTLQEMFSKCVSFKMTRIEPD